MANPEHLVRIKEGRCRWNDWRRVHPTVTPDLSASDFHGLDLEDADLSGCSFFQADLRKAKLVRANLRNANLGGAELAIADLSEANLEYADFRGAKMRATVLRAAKFSRAVFGATILADIDLSETSGPIGLNTVQHSGPSTIGIDTLLVSRGRIPEVFLKGAGVPDVLIAYMRSIATTAIEFYSCFISYSTKDQEFADQLYADLQAKGVRCWFAPHDIQGGKKIHEQIDDAIQIHDRLLLILSEHSIHSEWVKTEIAKARKREVRENRRMLFPIRLVPFETLRDWECFDADLGKDSAREIREFYVPDFSRWEEDHDEYRRELDRLLRDLRATGRHAPRLQ